MANITPIFAVQTTNQNNATSTEVDANCKTTALANGTRYAVFFRAHGGGVGTVGNLRFRFGSSGTPSNGTLLGETVERSGPGAYSGPLCGCTIVTGNGSDVLKFSFLRVSGPIATRFDEGYIIALPLDIFPENVDQFFVGDDSATLQLTDAPAGAWTTVVDETWDLGSSDDWFVFMSVEASTEEGSAGGAARVQFLVDGNPLINIDQYVREWEDDTDWLAFGACAIVSGLSGSTVFEIQGRSRQDDQADFRRGRIMAIRASRFSQYVQATDSAGAQLNAATETSLLTQDYTPVASEYVLAFGSAVTGSSTVVGNILLSLRNQTDAVRFQAEAGHHTVDAGYDSGSDQFPEVLMGVQQLTSAGVQKTFEITYSRNGSNSSSIGRRADGTTAVDSHLILLSLTIDTTNFNITPDPVELALSVPTPMVVAEEVVVTPDPVALFLTISDPVIDGIPTVFTPSTGNNLFRVLCTEQVNQKLAILSESDGIIEQALTGYLVKALDADGITELTYGEARNAFIDFTGALALAEDIVVPTLVKSYWVRNSTSGGQTVTIQTGLGSSVSLTSAWKLVHCDGANFILIKTGV